MGRGAFNDLGRILPSGECDLFSGGCLDSVQQGAGSDQGQWILSSWAHAGRRLRPVRVVHPRPGQWQNRASGGYSFIPQGGAHTPLLRLAARVVLTYLKSARRSRALGDQSSSFLPGTIAPLMVSR